MKLFSLVVLFASLAVAGEKPPLDWQPGTLVDQSSERQCSTHGRFRNGDGRVREDCLVVTEYTVSSREMVYVFSRSTFEREQLLPLTINGGITFATNGKAFYLMAEDGKAHEVRLLKKALRRAER